MKWTPEDQIQSFIGEIERDSEAEFGGISKEITV
jgi:hypothetical protein